MTKAHCPSSGGSWGSDFPEEFPENLYAEPKNKDEEAVYDEPAEMKEVRLDDSSNEGIINKHWSILLRIIYMVHVGRNSRESAIRMRATVLVLYVKDVIGERVRGR